MLDDLIFFILASFGLTQILIYGQIFDSIRPTDGWLGKLFHCPMCLGFWIGLFLWLISGFTSLFTFDTSILTGFLLGCVSSATSYILCMLFGDDGIRIEVKK